MLSSHISSLLADKGSRPLLLDGGMGRELHRMGAPFRQPEWSALSLMERPDLVQKAHEAFLQNGAEIITANNYALVPFHIGEERFSTDGKKLAQRAGHVGRAAIDQHLDAHPTHQAALAASLPPSCGSYRPDLFDPTKAEDILTTLIEGLAPSVDLWLAETQSSIAEIQTARRTLNHVIGKDDIRPFWVSFTLDDTHPASAPQQPITLRSGERLEDAIHAALELNVQAILFNCSDPRIMRAAIHTAQHAISTCSDTSPYLGVYANGFAHNHHDEDGEGANESITPLDGTLTPQRYTSFAQQWHEAGAAIIGGCCGIGPEHIAALAKHFSAQN